MKRTERANAKFFYLFATIVAFLGTVAAIVLAFVAHPAPVNMAPAACGGFGFTLAIAGWLHEGDWRWWTAESLAMSAAAIGASLLS